MKIAWCTPFTPSSAIGRFSALVSDELRQREGIEVDIWYPQGAGGRTWPDEGNELSPGAWSALRGYDYVVYQVGNQAAYHGPLLEACAAVPGLVVLHDISLTHLYTPLLLSKSAAAVNIEFRRWYGDKGMAEAEEFLASPAEWAWRPTAVRDFPMIEPAVEFATGVVTHSEFAARHVRDRFVGRISSIPLPALHFDDDGRASDLPDTGDGPVILQAGAITNNKRVELVIEAFSRLPEETQAHLVICGHATPHDLAALTALAASSSAAARIHVLGAVDDSTMAALRRRADIAVALRYPNTEAASAVLIDSFAYGCAVIAVDGGCYAEEPKDIVRLVPGPPTVDEIRSAMFDLLGDRAGTQAMGQRAAQHSRDVHTVANYADRILAELASSGASVRLGMLVEQMVGYLDRTGLRESEAATRAMANAAFELFSGNPRTDRWRIE